MRPVLRAVPVLVRLLRPDALLVRPTRLAAACLAAARFAACRHAAAALTVATNCRVRRRRRCAAAKANHATSAAATDAVGAAV